MDYKKNKLGFLRSHKYYNQRKKRGFSDFDVFDIDIWFLKIMPEMLQELIDKYIGFPCMIAAEYFEKQGKSYNMKDELSEETEKEIHDYWINILKEMRQAFLDAVAETTSYKNKYEDEYIEKFIENENIEEILRQVNEGLFSEEKELKEKYQKEQKTLEDFLEKNKKKALDMFVKYFDCLWW